MAASNVFSKDDFIADLRRLHEAAVELNFLKAAIHLQYAYYETLNCFYEIEPREIPPQCNPEQEADLPPL